MRSQLNPRKSPSQLADMLEAIDRGRFKIISLPEAAIAGLGSTDE